MTQGSHFGWHESIREVLAELFDELGGEVTVVDVIDRADGFFGVPGHLHLAPGVAGTQQAPQFGGVVRPRPVDSSATQRLFSPDADI
jgi:hypothetical protein